MGVWKDLTDLERHDQLILIAVVVLLLGIVLYASDLTTSSSLLRTHLIDLAVLLLIADIIIHIGKMERKLATGESRILTEEKKIEKRLEKKRR